MKKPVSLLFFVAASGIAAGCASQNNAAPEPHSHDAVVEEPELAAYMAELQRFSQKLGFAIAGRNHPLAEFYAAELEETLERLQEEVPEQEGLPIAQTSKVILDPLVEELGEALKAKDWKKSDSSYSALIDGCNRCHAATEHEFIEILPATGTPPFNQRF